MANSQSTTSGTPADLEMRVAQFAARTIAVCEALPKRVGSDHLRDQLFRSSTSVAANYAEACVPESRKDFAPLNLALSFVDNCEQLRFVNIPTQ